MGGPSAEVVAAGHICLDIIPAFTGKPGAEGVELAPGRLLAVGPAAISTGGAVSNTGLALHRLGVPTRLAGKVGDDLFGRAILDLLRAHDSSLAEGMIVAPGEPSSYTVVISPPGADRMFLHCAGANHTFGADDLPREALEGARLLHFGYPPLMRRMYADGGKEIERLFARAKGMGLATSLDMARPDPATEAGGLDWAALLARVLPQVDLFLPSLDEMLFMLDRERFERLEAAAARGGLAAGADGALLAALSGRLIGMGAAVAAIKLGDEGLYLRSTPDRARLEGLGRCAPAQPGAWLGRELLAPCFEVEAVGTTGAGDCAIAGLLAALLKGLAPEEAATAAVAVGACNVEQADALSGVPAWEAVQSRIRSGWPRRPTRLRLDGWQFDGERSLWLGPNDASAA